MLTHVAILMMGLSGQAAQQPPADPAHMSLAERAAAARREKERARGASVAAPASGVAPASGAGAAAPASLSDSSSSSSPSAFDITPFQRGSVRGGRYVNDFLHFQIDLGDRWEPLSPERMARDAAVLRDLERTEGIRGGSGRSRVLWISDHAGHNVILGILRVPPGADADQEKITAALKQAAFVQLPTARQVDEPVAFGDPAHRFSGFRIASTVMSKTVVQSMQTTLLNGYLVVFTITGTSDESVTETLRDIRARLTWTTPSAAHPAPEVPRRRDPFAPPP